VKNDNLAIYLNDHLAGSVAAIEMIEHLITVHQGTPVGQFCKALNSDINSDQAELRQLMRSLEVKESTVRKAGAWLAEKFSRPKLGPSHDGPDAVGLFEALESLRLGINGKESLWRTLKAVRESWPQMNAFDLERLEKRAIEQGERVDTRRLDVARQILTARA
jgi:hypothetical protein